LCCYGFLCEGAAYRKANEQKREENEPHELL
jgi:hypothetical protein